MRKTDSAAGSGGDRTRGKVFILSAAPKDCDGDMNILFRIGKEHVPELIMHRDRSEALREAGKISRLFDLDVEVAEVPVTGHLDSLIRLSRRVQATEFAHVEYFEEGPGVRALLYMPLERKEGELTRGVLMLSCGDGSGDWEVRETEGKLLRAPLAGGGLILRGYFMEAGGRLEPAGFISLRSPGAFSYEGEVHGDRLEGYCRYSVEGGNRFQGRKELDPDLLCLSGIARNASDRLANRKTPF